jgi:hypothetical protein
VEFVADGCSARGNAGDASVFVSINTEKMHAMASKKALLEVISTI